MSTVQTSALEIQLIDDVSPAARVIAEALKRAEKQAKETAEVLGRSGASDKLQASLKKLGAGKDQIEGVSKAWRDYAKAQDLAAERKDWTRDQINAVRSWEGLTVASLRAVVSAERATATQRRTEGQRDADARVADARRATEGLLKVEQRLREQLLEADERSADQRLAKALAAARTRAGASAHVDVDALRVDQQLRAQIEAAITTDLRREQGLRIAASQEEAAAMDRIAVLEKDRRIRLVQEETAAIVKARHLEQERLQEQQAHAVNRAGFRHYVAGGIVAGVSAHGVVSGIEGAVEAGAERAHVLTGMKNAGMPDEEIARAQTTAMAVARNAPNMTVSELLELHKEARSAVQHPDEVDGLMPDLAKAASVLKGMGAENVNVADLVKAGESLGLMNDPARFHKFLDGQVRAMSVLGKTIDTTQVYEASKYSKSAGATLSDEFINLTLPSLIQEMHGSSAGDALSALTKRWRGGLAHQHLAVERLDQMGLLEDPGQIKRSKTGEIMGYMGKLKGDGLLGSDPDKFFHEVWEPAAEAIGAKTLADKIKLLNETLPSTAANLGRILIQQEESLKQHRVNNQNAAGLDQAVDNQRRDPTVAWASLKASFNDLMSSVSGPAMTAAATGLNALSDAVKRLSAEAAAHPTLALAAGGIAAGGALYGAGRAGFAVMNGFGLGTAATALDGSAAALTEAAVKLGAAGTIGGAASTAGGATAAAGVTAGGVLAGVAAVAAPIAVGIAAQKDYDRQKAANEAYMNTPEGKALPDLKDQTWGEFVRGAVPQGHLEEDRATRARPGDAPAKSLWHRIFGANEGGFIPASFSDEIRSPESTSVRAGSSEAQGMIEQGVYDGVTRAFEALRDGGGRSGGGLINASYKTGGDGGSGAGGAGGGGGSGGGGGGARSFDGKLYSGSGDSASVQEHVGFIRKAAAALGIDPNVAVRVANSEGLHSFYGDRNTSFGDFQLHIKNNIPGLSLGGLGDVFRKETGLDPSNPHNWRAMDLFALKKAREQGWGAWHGAARIGVFGRAGIGAMPKGVPLPGTGGDEDPLALSKRPASGHPAGRIEAAVDNQHLHETVALLDHIHGRIGDINQVSARNRGRAGAPAISHRRGFMADGTALA